MKTKMKTAALAALGAAAAAALYLSPFGATAQNSMMMMAGGTDQVWDAFGGNQQAQKYSTATQITPENVKDLKRAWSIHTGDVSSGVKRTIGSAANCGGTQPSAPIRIVRAGQRPQRMPSARKT